MNQPTLKDLAELAGMTEEELNNKVFGFRCRHVSKEDAAKDLALALVKARLDEAEKFEAAMICEGGDEAHWAIDEALATIKQLKTKYGDPRANP